MFLSLEPSRFMAFLIPVHASPATELTGGEYLPCLLLIDAREAVLSTSSSNEVMLLLAFSLRIQYFKR